MTKLYFIFQMYGSPLHFPYINMKTAINKIKSIELHLNNDSTVEFALGVEIFSYPNCVISVWVFLACITRN